MKRVSVIILQALVLTAVLWAGGAAEKAAPASGAAPSRPAAEAPKGKYNEAPALAVLVREGKLPPVDQRLPKQPVVVKPVESIGKYGGTWRSVWRGVADNRNIANHLRYARLVRLNADTGLELFPDICDRWEFSKDAREYTYHIREGIKWSDGKPLTTDDVAFWWKDIIHNKELTPKIPSVLTAGGQPATLEVKDALTFVVKFQKSYGLFAVMMAANDGEPFFIASPKHYLSQFHPGYTPREKLEQMAKEAKFGTWVQLFGQKSNWLTNPDLPVMTAFLPRTAPDETGRTVWVRNPYYYKVDTAGNQLPYIDQVEFRQSTKVDVAVLMAANGEIDLQIRYFRDLDFTPLKQNERQGNYTVVPYYELRGNTDATLAFNQTTSDPVLRKIFNDVRFRQAVSLSMNREEINKVNFLGLAKPRQASFPTGDPYYDADWAKWYAEYDPARANRLLDEMGLTRRDAGGLRLRPDGKTLEVIFEFASSDGKSSPLEELQKEYMEKVGIKVNLQPRDRALYTERLQTPEVQLSRWSFGGDFLGMYGDLIPTGNEGGWGTQWGIWFASGGKAGEEPPADLKRVNELIGKAYGTAEEAERRAAVQEIVKLWKANLWNIGTVGENPRAGVIKNDFKNVPRNMPYGGFLSVPAPYAEQFYLAR